MFARPFIATLCLLASLTGAGAASASPTVAEEQRSIESFAAANKRCGEWTDGCLVCTRTGDAAFACSLPGIACQPSGLRCGAVPPPATEPAPPEPDPKKAGPQKPNPQPDSPKTGK